jgi:hypothetical protein
MSKENEFFIYLLERYAEYKQKSANIVLSEWEKLGLTQFIYDMYELYHIERLQNAFEDIDNLVWEKQKYNGN